MQYVINHLQISFGITAMLLSNKANYIKKMLSSL